MTNILWTTTGLNVQYTVKPAMIYIINLFFTCAVFETYSMVKLTRGKCQIHNQSFSYNIRCSLNFTMIDTLYVAVHWNSSGAGAQPTVPLDSDLPGHSDYKTNLWTYLVFWYFLSQRIKYYHVKNIYKILLKKQDVLWNTNAPVRGKFQVAIVKTQGQDFKI
jgi:hypothetical protein